MTRLRAAVLLVFALAIPAEAQGIKGAKGPGPVPYDAFNDRPKASPKRGGDLIQAEAAGFRSLDGEQDNSATTSEVINYIQEGLIDSDVETWATTPKLAERWDVEDNVELKDGKVVRGKVTEIPDGVEVRDPKGDVFGLYKKSDVKEVRYGTSFTFHLRKDVKFHNGDPFTSKDVEFTVKLLRHPKNGMPNIQGYFAKIVECAPLDAHTVRMTFSEQYWMALDVCGGYIRVRPHRVWDPEGLLEKDPDAFFKKFTQHPNILHPIGTGPYQFDSYKKDFEVVLKRWDGYYDPKKTPQWPDRLRFRIIKDPVAQLQSLKNGEVDLVTSIPPDIWHDFFAKPENLKDFGKVEMVYPSYGYVGFNMRRDLWKDKRVRWALALGSVDNDKFIREILRGQADRVTGPMYRYSPSSHPDLKTIPYDPKKAEEILAEAGWFDSDGDGLLDKDGKKFEFTLLVRDMPPTLPAMQWLLQMQQNLRKLGIRMDLQKLEWAAFLDKIDRGDFDVCRLAWALSSPPDRQDPFQIWHSSSIGESGSNHVAYANPEVDRLITAMRRELDPAKRMELERSFQKIIYEDQPYNFLYMPAELRAYNKKWRGVRFWVPRPGHSLNEWYLGE
jgi:peptide/nickel transport system substrate-binding protein